MKFLFVVLLIIPVISYSQINKTDSNGYRQGIWEKQYPNGVNRYKGQFRDNKPVGKWKRYYDSGKTQAEIDYSETSDSAFAKLYDKMGRLMALGVFINEKRTGNWKYFSNNILISEVEFLDGIKNGISKKYYRSGELIESSEWNQGVKEGKYRAFFKNGKTYMECMYKNNKRDGFCIIYYDNERMKMAVSYKEDKRHGDWNFYDDKGNLHYTLKYDMGQLLNPEVSDSIQKLKLNESNIEGEDIADPELFMNNPEEYLKRSKQNK